MRNVDQVKSVEVDDASLRDNVDKILNVLLPWYVLILSVLFQMNVM